LHKDNRNKKGLSEIIGYVLLIVFAISMSVLVYAWLRASTPKAEVACPDAVSIELTEYYSIDAPDEGNANYKRIYLNVTNRGLFGINGVSITLKEGTKACQIVKVACQDFEDSCEYPGKKILFKQFLTQGMMKQIYMVYDSSACAPNKVELIPMRASESGIILCDKSIIKESITT